MNRLEQDDVIHCKTYEQWERVILKLPDTQEFNHIRDVYHKRIQSSRGDNYVSWPVLIYECDQLCGIHHMENNFNHLSEEEFLRKAGITLGIKPIKSIKKHIFV